MDSRFWTLGLIACVLLTGAKSDEPESTVGSEDQRLSTGMRCYVWYRGRPDLDQYCVGHVPDMILYLSLRPEGDKLLVGTFVNATCTKEKPPCSSIKTDITMTRNKSEALDVQVKWTATWDSKSPNKLSKHGVEVRPASMQEHQLPARETAFWIDESGFFFRLMVTRTIGNRTLALDLADGMWDLSFAVSKFDASGKQIGDTQLMPSVAASLPHPLVTLVIATLTTVFTLVNIA